MKKLIVLSTLALVLALTFSGCVEGDTDSLSADDVKLSTSLTAASVFDDGTLDGDISPGKK